MSVPFDAVKKYGKKFETFEEMSNWKRLFRMYSRRYARRAGIDPDHCFDYGVRK